MEFVFDDKIINCMDEDALLNAFKKMYDAKKYVQCVLYIEKKLSAFSNKFYEVMILYLHSLIQSPLPRWPWHGCCAMSASPPSLLAPAL